MKNQRLIILMLSILITAISACTPVSPSPTVTPTATVGSSLTPESTLTATPTITPTPYPFGSEQNPITLGLVYSDQDLQQPAAEEFVQYLADNTGLIFELRTFESDFDLLMAFEKGEVSFAWLQPVPYLYASESNTATVAFLTSHYGIYYYGSQFLVNSQSDFSSYFDPRTGRTTDSADVALSQFAEKIPCLVNAKSLTGYVLPLGILADAGIQVQEPVLLNSHESVVRAVYAGGICDFGVTYGLSGDPRTASSIQKDLPDVMEKVIIVWQTDPIIPTLNLSFSTSLPQEIRREMTDVITQFMEEPTARQTISDMNNYTIEELREVGDNAYESLRNYLMESGVSLDSLLEP